MKFKENLNKIANRTKAFWKTGKLQKSSRITYDVVWNVILFFLIVGVIGGFFAAGVGAGYFASLVRDEPIRTHEAMAEDIYNYAETSKLFFADNIYIGDVQADIHREKTTLDKVSPVLVNAVIATEDEYFEEHDGVVPKAILRAVLQEAMNSSVQTGGSTLTQQLIKNQILTNEVSFERKAKEILLALRLERFFEKEEILEAYLNIIPYGRDASGNNIAGIQTAAQGIFGINADEVNIAQAAYLAGLPQSPSAYTPFQNSGGLKDEEGIQPGINRMATVLYRMLDMGYITKEEYEEAIDYDIVADFEEEKPSPVDTYPYLTYELQNRAKSLIKDYLVERDGYTNEDLKENEELNAEYNELAERALESNGYEIHSTIDKEIYEAFHKIANEYQYYGNNSTITYKNAAGENVTESQQIQTGGMLIENSTGRIISFLGGREYTEENQINYAFRTRSPGSTIKPLLDYAPAMEKGVVQPGTPLADYNKTFYFPNNGPYAPGNYAGGFYGLVSARTALANSYNIPAVEAYRRVYQDNPTKEYLEKMGITTLTEADHVNPSLAIGGIEYGVTVEENTNAFATFANNGKFADAYMIEKITTRDGEVIYEHETETVDVFSPQTSYLTIDMMRSVINNGTATYVNSQLKYKNVDWAGKTGTSQDFHDAWFVATNPNVTFGTWIGYKRPQSIYDPSYSLSYSQRNNKLWAELINAASDINPDLVAPSKRFERPEGIVERSYCAISGLLPSDLCKEAGLVKSDLFNAKFVPTKTDDSLVRGNTVLVDGKSVAPGPNTPSEFTTGEGLTFNPDWMERMGYDDISDITQLYPRTETEKWQKIGAPAGKSGGSVEDDGKAPSAPSDLKKSGDKLTWKKSGSKDVVGYRIYRATEPGGNFKLIGSTTSTDFKIGNGNAVYHVKAVDYFGEESSASKELIVGETKSDEGEKPDEDKDENTDDNEDSDDRSDDDEEDEDTDD